jgi:hypothetical protein
VCRFLAGARDFSPLRRVKTTFGGHPVSYSVCTGALYPGMEWTGREVYHFRLAPTLRMLGAMHTISHMPPMRAVGPTLYFTAL